ncbi:hypothetical protein J4N02_08335 [Propioniciclava sp. MC1595]|uniref:hypothetical protein n=1 Tax=unclassified Propioniciclava TaxID=2642922 RepID=UPI0015FEECDF|nr:MULTISPECIES: hypothetical protein [unclassified Propioniciclava]MBB1495892.1 hypothetical protein [Propioniciclava sp. MC1595]MBB1500619.1 hypothetical protein [Propioniciclava sp. MC1683]QTE24608.1 hypothetical protein J4N02_08335 [Propioniciclava sp. MC1595]
MSTSGRPYAYREPAGSLVRAPLPLACGRCGARIEPGRYLVLEHDEVPVCGRDLARLGLADVLTVAEAADELARLVDAGRLPEGLATIAATAGRAAASWARDRVDAALRAHRTARTPRPLDDEDEPDGLDDG